MGFQRESDRSLRQLRRSNTRESFDASVDRSIAAVASPILKPLSREQRPFPPRCFRRVAEPLGEESRQAQSPPARSSRRSSIVALSGASRSSVHAVLPFLTNQIV